LSPNFEVFSADSLWACLRQKPSKSGHDVYTDVIGLDQESHYPTLALCQMVALRRCALVMSMHRLYFIMMYEWVNNKSSNLMFFSVMCKRQQP